VIALDTNVIVRLLVADDPVQFETARKIFRAENLWLSKTALLETEWVLRYSYDQSPDTILKAFRKLLGYPQLQVEDRGAVLRALALFEERVDFADALHLASSGESDRFVTFDRDFAKAMRNREDGPPVDLLK
jgi:predicted nucleic-acid-binding protein